MTGLRLGGKALVIASHNEGKVREISALLAPLGIEVVSAAALDLPAPEETGEDFTANARLKALAAARASDRVALADDSGLSVDALDGAPGIYSARWAGPGKDFAAAMARVHAALLERDAKTPQDRRARFVCALCLAAPDGVTKVFEGEVHGHLIWPPRGSFGFGYDPMFLADGERETFGEMEPARKHAISHRARAFAKLTEAMAAEDIPN